METRNHIIYAYQDPAVFLKDAWYEKKQSNPSFTIRAWAKKMNMKGHNPLYEVIRGVRKLPKSYIPAIVSSLALTTREGLYLEALADLQRAKTAQAKEYFLNRILDLSPKEHMSFFELDSFNFFKDPAHFALLEMTELNGFKSQISWIQKKLGVKKSAMEIQRMIDRLVAQGFLEIKNGKLTKSKRHIFSKVDRHEEALKEYHRQIMSYAKGALDNQTLEDREFNGVCMNIEERHIRTIKLELREFREKLISKYEAKEGQAKDTYQLNMQLFNLNKKIN